MVGAAGNRVARLNQTDECVSQITPRRVTYRQMIKTSGTLRTRNSVRVFGQKQNSRGASRRGKRDRHRTAINHLQPDDGLIKPQGAREIPYPQLHVTHVRFVW